MQSSTQGFQSPQPIMKYSPGGETPEKVLRKRQPINGVWFFLRIKAKALFEKCPETQ